MKKTYQIPALYQDNVLDGCQLLVGTTIPVSGERNDGPNRILLTIK